MTNKDNIRLELPDLLTTKEVAFWLGISRERVYSLCSTQKLPNIKISSRRIRFSVGDLEDWLKERGWKGG
ncbi:MAG: helix-turn-helix domain-containing protein [Candidatus Dadabacteria bacterium]|nr:helix-turn-helix domain-containing protein [Candidatus Dadabacteria bacterium]